MLRRTMLGLVFLGAACTERPTAPRQVHVPPRLTTAASDQSGPPAPYAFGRDSYRTGLFTGAGITRPGLRCAPQAGAARACTGYLASGVDGTRLDVTLQEPRGSGPFPLVVLLHGWAGSKGGSSDIADSLVADGYAVLRYSARGFGESWGQANLADQHVELRDLRSLVGQLVDRRRFHVNPDAVAVTGASYGGGQSWLAALVPTFTSPRGRTVRIRTVVPIVPWTDLLYSLLPNGRERRSVDGLGGAKLSYIDGLFVSGLRHSTDRPYPNYPPYLFTWDAWIDAVEPNDIDPVYRRIIDGLAGGRSIWWQQTFWSGVAATRLPVFEVQGFTDDLFPLPEAARMVRALRTIDPSYPIALYLGDLGHPRAANKPGEVDYVLGLIRQWLAFYLKGTGTEPAHVVYAAITRPRDRAFDPSDVITVPTLDVLATDTLTHAFEGTSALVNPASDPTAGFFWDPFVMMGSEELKPLPPPPDAPLVTGSLFADSVRVSALDGGAGFDIAGAPRVSLQATSPAPRVQLDVRLFDVAPDGSRQLITRGTYTLDGHLLPIGTTTVTIPTYGNLWQLAPDHWLRLELTNVDAPYIAPSRVPSATLVSNVSLEIPMRP